MVARRVAAIVALLAPLTATAGGPNLDPDKVFYAASFNDPNQTGSITAHALTPPYAVQLKVSGTQMNGAITLDRPTALLYGGHCCSAATSTIFAYSATALFPMAAKNITVANSGSMAIEVDAAQRVLYVFDTVSRKLTAVS